MGKKKFIDKNNSQKFHLLHRSMLDEAHAQEGVPSEFVLVAADQMVDPKERINRYSAPSESVTEAFKSKRRDHVNEFGFYNDGYDYSQHLREMGGGKYYGKDGQFHDNIRPSVVLPDEVLPSANHLQRDYNAITISHEVMDDDLHAALFEDADEEGEFELLDDDFVMQVMQEPEVPDFDFDAHIAALIARSEQCVGSNKPRGWDDADAKKLKKIKNKKSLRFEDIGEDGEVLDGEDDEDDEGFDDDDSGVYDFDPADFNDTDPARKELSDFDKQRRAVLDHQLEEALEEYDDAHIGDLEEVMGSDIEGDLDFEDLENNEALNQALDEFLEAEKDLVLAGGAHVKKGSRNVLLLKKNENNEYVHEELHPVVEGPIDFKKESAEQVLLQQEWAQQVKDLERESKDIEKDLATCQEYLREVKIEEEWDCETIISTYSTLDNHPTVIKDPKSKFKSYKSKFQREQEHQAALQYSDTASVASKASSKSKINKPVVQPTITGKIILSGKLNLPLGFGPQPIGKPKTERPRGNLSAIQESTVNDNDEEEEDDDDDRENDETNSNESDRDEKGDEKPEGWVEREKKVKARKKETAEEKKARKQATKEERKIKRSSKKQLKNMFKQEGSKIIQTVGKEQTINNVSVFKYSA